MLTNLRFAPFDAKLYVASIRDLTALDRVLEAVELFRSTHDRAHAVDMLRQVLRGMGRSSMTIGIKRLLSVIEMARQDHEAVAERLVSLLKDV